MQNQQSSVPVMITLIGLGLIASAFGFITWLAWGASEPVPVANTPNRDAQALAESTLISDVASSDIGSSTAASTQLNNQSTAPEVPQGLFSYGGSSTWVPVHANITSIVENTFPGFQLRYTLPASGAPGSGVGIKMLLDGQLSFAESSRPLKPVEYADAQQRGFTLEQIPTAIDGIAVAINPDLGMAGLNVAQLRSIYAGQVSNWSELGGPDVPLTAYSRSPAVAGTANYFLGSIVGLDAYGEEVVFVGDTTSGIRQVARNKGGIYYASATEIVRQCTIYAVPIASQEQPGNFIKPFVGNWRTGQACIDQSNQVNNETLRSGDYPLTRRLFVIVKADGTVDEAAGRTYANMLLSPRGQNVLQDAGFVSIR